jgi:hypothetical protein
MAPGLSFYSNFKGFREVSVFNKEILDTARHVRLDELDQNSMFLEICALLGYYAASCSNCLSTLRDNVSVPSSQVKSPSRKA